jgi:hypothetical protein
MLVTKSMPYWLSASGAVMITATVTIGVSYVFSRHIDTDTTSFSRLAGKNFDLWFTSKKSRAVMV